MGSLHNILSGARATSGHELLLSCFCPCRFLILQ